MVKIIAATVFTCLFISVSSCSDGENKSTENNDQLNEEKSNSEIENTTVSIKKGFDKIEKDFSLKDFYGNDSFLEEYTNRIFESLSDEQRVAQMIITSGGRYGNPKEKVVDLVKNDLVGGVLLLNGSKDEFAGMIREYNGITNQNNSIPLLFSCDAEPTLFNMKIKGTPKVLATNQIKFEDECIKVTETITNTIKEIGFNVNYAPVVDYGINKEIIGNRAFGNDFNTVATFSSIFINETQNRNVVATAKHFPGHGNVKGDSHNKLVFINGKLIELDNFKNAIDAGVVSIMVGHIAVNNNKNYDTKGLPATLSRKIVTDLLKNEMGFKGIVVTDAMNMGAVINFPTPSFNAVKAGCDMILMPTDERKLLSSILSEMENNPSFKEQVYNSVKKIIRLKICLNLFKLKTP